MVGWHSSNVAARASQGANFRSKASCKISEKRFYSVPHQTQRQLNTVGTKAGTGQHGRAAKPLELCTTITKALRVVVWDSKSRGGARVVLCPQRPTRGARLETKTLRREHLPFRLTCNEAAGSGSLAGVPRELWRRYLYQPQSPHRSTRVRFTTSY